MTLRGSAGFAPAFLFPSSYSNEKMTNPGDAQVSRTDGRGKREILLRGSPPPSTALRFGSHARARAVTLLQR